MLICTYYIQTLKYLTCKLFYHIKETCFQVHFKVSRFAYFYHPLIYFYNFLMLSPLINNRQKLCVNQNNFKHGQSPMPSLAKLNKKLKLGLKSFNLDFIKQMYSFFFLFIHKWPIFLSFRFFSVLLDCSYREVS